MSERFRVVPVAAHESALGDETDGDTVFDAGVGEGERAERRGSVPILQYSREPNKYGPSHGHQDQTTLLDNLEFSGYLSSAAEEQKKLSPDLAVYDGQLKPLLRHLRCVSLPERLSICHRLLTVASL
ncbi:hypothetical protein PO909_017547 [Leuciscus waleckii]